MFQDCVGYGMVFLSSADGMMCLTSDRLIYECTSRNIESDALRLVNSLNIQISARSQKRFQYDQHNACTVKTRPFIKNYLKVIIFVYSPVLELGASTGVPCRAGW